MTKSFIHSIMALGLATAALSACAMNNSNSTDQHSRWSKANVTQAQATADAGLCHDTAMKRPNADTIPEQAAFDQCMLGRGYNKM